MSRGECGGGGGGCGYYGGGGGGGACGGDDGGKAAFHHTRAFTYVHLSHLHEHKLARVSFNISCAEPPRGGVSTQVGNKRLGNLDEKCPISGLAGQL